MHAAHRGGGSVAVDVTTASAVISRIAARLSLGLADHHVVVQRAGAAASCFS